MLKNGNEEGLGGFVVIRKEYDKNILFKILGSCIYYMMEESISNKNKK